MDISIRCNSSFRAIQLSAKEADNAATGINRLLDKGLTHIEKQGIKNDLFTVFEKHLQKEAKTKTRYTLLYEEVLAELYLKFSELLYNIKKNPTLEIFVDKLNKYSPSKDTMKSEYIHKSLDAPANRGNSPNTIRDFISEKNLPDPTSVLEKEAIKAKLNSAIENANFSEIMEGRIQNKANGGMTIAIARKEGVGVRVIQKSVQKSILRIQRQNNNLPQEYIDKAVILADLFGCNIEKMLTILLQHIDLFSKKPEKFMQNIKESAELLGCTEQEFIKAALRQPTIFGMKPETIMQNVILSSKIFHCDQKTFIKTALYKQPALFYLKPETIEMNIKKSAENIGCTEKEFIKASLRDPSLVYIKSETLLKNVQESCRLLQCSKEDFVKAALKQPNLFYCKPKTFKNNVDRSSELLGCSVRDYVVAALKHGALLYQKPETLKNNVRKSAELLNISEEKFVQSALKHPPLFFQKPETLKDNAEGVAKYLNISIEEYLERVSGKPTVLSQKPETVISKLRIMAYYQKIKNEQKQNVVIVQDSDGKLYEQILSYLIKQLNNKEFEPFVKLRKYFDFEAFLKANTDKHLVLEIPKDEVAEDFIKYIQETSEKVIGKNIFEFKITKQV